MSEEKAVVVNLAKGELHGPNAATPPLTVGAGHKPG